MKQIKKKSKKTAPKKKQSILSTNLELKFLFISTIAHIASRVIIYIFSKNINPFVSIAETLIPVLLLLFSFRFRPLKILRYPTWIFISYCFTQFVITLINTAFRDYISTNIYISIISVVFFALFFAVVLFAPNMILKKPLIDRDRIGFKGLPTWTDIALALIGFVFYILLSAILSKIFELFPFFDAVQKQETVYDPNFLFTTIDRLIALITIAVIPPIVEEIVFRGWLYLKLRQNIKKFSILISIIITSILFGFMHGQWNVGVGVFAMSVISCLIRELTGTIYGSILLHMIANFVAFYLVFILQI